MIWSVIACPQWATASRPRSVSVKPTDTAFALMPYLPSSRAMTRIMASRPAFAAAVCDERGEQALAAMEDTAMIAPPRC